MVGNGFANHFFQGGDDLRAAMCFVAPVEASEPDVREVLDPFKIRNCDAARIEVGVGYDGFACFAQYVVCHVSDGTVGRFCNYWRFDAFGIFKCDLAFSGGWYKYVAFCFEQAFAICNIRGSREVF